MEIYSTVDDFFEKAKGGTDDYFALQGQTPSRLNYTNILPIVADHAASTTKLKKSKTMKKIGNTLLLGGIAIGFYGSFKSDFFVSEKNHLENMKPDSV